MVLARWAPVNASEATGEERGARSLSGSVAEHTRQRLRLLDEAGALRLSGHAADEALPVVDRAQRRGEMVGRGGA
jgi:hypothetical protein